MPIRPLSLGALALLLAASACVHVAPSIRDLPTRHPECFHPLNPPQWAQVDPARLAPGPGLPPGPPEAALVARLEAALDEAFLLSGAKGLSVAVALPGRGLWKASRGDAGRGPLGPDMAMMAGSILKPMVATLILQEVEAGHLSLDDTVTRWYPEVPGGAEVRVHHLLEHTSGILDYYLVAGLESPSYVAPDRLIREAFRHGQVFRPGTYHHYSNTGYLMLGRILERVTGRSFAELLETRLTFPLGLTHTGLCTPERERHLEVLGHVRGQRPVAPVCLSTPFSAGALLSTPEDLVRFQDALLRGHLLGTASLARMTGAMHRSSPDTPKVFYGLGTVLIQGAPGGDHVGHAGGIQGFQACLFHHLSSGASLAVQVNDEPKAGRREAEPVLFRLVEVLQGLPRVGEGGLSLLPLTGAEPAAPFPIPTPRPVADSGVVR